MSKTKQQLLDEIFKLKNDNYYLQKNLDDTKYEYNYFKSNICSIFGIEPKDNKEIFNILSTNIKIDNNQPFKIGEKFYRIINGKIVIRQCRGYTFDDSFTYINSYYEKIPITQCYKTEEEAKNKLR